MPAPLPPSRHPTTALVLLVLFAVPGAWLLLRIDRTYGLSSPHLWTLLREDPVFGFAMLDFFLTAAWAALVLLERGSTRDWRLWASLALFCVIPTLGIVAFVLLHRHREPKPS